MTDAARAFDEFLASQNQGNERWIISDDARTRLIAFVDAHGAERTAALREENERLRRFLDFVARTWITSEHLTCNPSCIHRKIEDDRFSELDALLADHEGQRGLLFDERLRAVLEILSTKLVREGPLADSPLLIREVDSLLANSEGQRTGEASTERIRAMALGEACLLVARVAMDMKDMAESFRVPMDATCEEIITRLIDAGAPRPVERARQEYRG